MNRKERSVFAQRLSQSRKKKGWTQLELAEKLCVNKNSITNWETDNSKPTFETLVEMIRLLNVSADWLLGIQE